MGWDRKRRGPSTGYYYRTVRVPGKLHPVKVYLGRSTAAHEAEAAVERARADREAIRSEREAVAEADRLTEGVRAVAGVLATAWLTLTGHHHHRGQWRKRRGEKEA